MKLIYIVFTAALLSVSTVGRSQENLILNKIEEQRSLGAEFVRVENIFSVTAPDLQLISKASDKANISFYKYDRSKFGLLGEAISLHIPGKDRNLEIELLHVPDSFYSYSVVTSDGKTLNADEHIKHYRGIVKGEKSSLVAFSFSENEVIGLVATDEGNFNFAAISNGERYVFFNENDITVTDFPIPVQFENDVADSRTKSYDPKVLSQESKLAINSSDKCVRFYFETEFDIFQNKGSVQNVELFVTSIYNQVAILYQNENIGTYISQIFVWNTTDPYIETDTQTLLNNFQNTRTSFEGDLGQLLTFRSVGGGRAAGLNGLCNSSTSNKLSVAGISATFNGYPVYSFPVKVITHEFGHLLGSDHTHACIWNGNNTAIDGCVATSCWNPGLPSGGGTIMSYCNQVSSVGVNFTKGFGTQPGNVIRNSVANASCLCNCMDSSISGTSYLCSTSSCTLNSPPSGSSISWTASPTTLFSGTTSGTGTSVTLTPYDPNTRGQAKLTFTITRSCGVVQFNKMIWVQAPEAPGSITGNTSPGPSSLSPYYINNLPAGATSMTWSLPYCVGCSQPWSFYSGQTSTMMTASVGDSDGYVQAMGVNPCGTGGASLLYVTPSGSCDPCPRMYPNPVSNEMTLEWMDAEGFVMSEEIDFYQVSLYNAVGGIILTETTNKPSIKIDLSQLKNGFYYLHIEGKDGLIRKQIRVER